MTISDIKIGTQLKLGFGFIALLILILCGVAWQQTNEMAQETKDLYEHPLMVRRALGELKADVLSIHRGMKDLGLAVDPKERLAILQQMEVFKADAFKQIDVMYDRYLGPRSDVDKTHNDFIKWNTIRNETIRILKEGKVDEALERTKANGEGGKYVDLILADIQMIDNFALSKGDEFFQNTIKLNRELNLKLFLLIVSIVVLAVFIIYLLIRNIRRPLAELSQATQLFKAGKFDVRSAYRSKNEFGQLSGAFNEMAQTIEDEFNLNKRVAKISAIMLSEDDARRFSHALLTSLLAQTGAQTGAVYLLNDAKTTFDHFECIGLSPDGCQPFSAIHFEGEFGPALASKKMQHITHIPDDTRFKFSTVLGTFTPRGIITIPIVVGGETIAVISLATIKSFGKESIRLIETIQSTLNARMGGVLAYRKLTEFTEQLEQKNLQLDAQRKELAKASAYTRSLIEASVDPLVTIGADGKIMDVNLTTEQITGCTRGELIGADFSNYFTEPERAKAGYQQVFREGFVRDYELAIRSANGQVVPVLYNASVYRDEEGKVLGVFAAARDITERKQAENEMYLLNKELTRKSEILSITNAELESQKNELSAQASELTEQNIELEMQKKQLDEANQMKTSFLANMSHELRTPLNSVIALSGVLGRRLSGVIAEEEYSYIDVIERNGKHLLSLINDILDLSRIEAGREDIEINKFTIATLLSEVVDMIAPQANQKGIHLNVVPNNELPQLTSDFEKCRHILQNLVANAVKFTEEGGVDIAGEVKDGYVYITVHDTGIGIAKEHLGHIFDEFRQADGSNSRKYGGTGLGLAIAKRYAQLLGGNITVESIRGQGSKFTLKLPIEFNSEKINAELHAERDITTLPRAEKKLDHPNAHEKTILLVEDSEAIVIQMKDILTFEGYTIRVARDGAEALEQIAQQLPDAMILDLMMPGVDGFEVLKQIRENKTTEQLPVIILTAKYVSKEELAFLKHNHVHQLIRKGDVNKDQLMNTVARMLSPEKIEVKKPVPLKIEGTPSVLVVEDNPDNLLTIKVLLDGNYNLIEATDGLSGVEMAIKHRPHLILMDIALPGMNGIEALNIIRRNEDTQYIPIVAVSASAMKGDKESFISLGFDGYVSKPIDHKELVKTIKYWVG
jgi:PAS domain S-box-containing protein